MQTSGVKHIIVMADLLKNYSGGSYPGVMYLKKTNDGYRVTKTKYAEDGESTGEIDLEVM